jgi:hypothetical protein
MIVRYRPFHRERGNKGRLLSRTAANDAAPVSVFDPLGIVKPAPF